MRVAYFSPLPPTPSGIADYSEALTGPLSRLTDLEVFTSRPNSFEAARYDAILYQIGNNPHHGFAYEMALAYPGVAVLHEANLHHLIAELTIRRGDWESYLSECEYEAGPAGRAYAERVRALETGPDYEGVPMLRRVLEASRAIIVHSRYMEAQVRRAGFKGPIAAIPHGTRILEGDRNQYRFKLGLDETTPLAGIFGFLKPYKRVTESLRAFRRLLRLIPNARLILVGEQHPDLRLEPVIRSLGLSASVRLLGFANAADFTGYMAACDAVLNLRYPTVGETSGPLLRAFGLGKAAIVSDVGAFSELPDDICVKVPVGEDEEDAILEYLNLLLARPEIGRRIGDNARAYASRECSWELVARRYAEFLSTGQASAPPAVGEEPETREEPSAVAAAASGIDAPPGPSPAPARTGLDYVLSWAADVESKRYIETHQTRLLKTLELVPSGCPEDRILEMGAYLQITPALRSRLGYGEVRGCYYGETGTVDRKSAESSAGELFECEIDHFDAERDLFPYPDAHFATVLCCELIEHLAHDPMHMMSEVNRILRPGGHFVLTTPNIASLRALAAVLNGYHPGFFPAYLRPAAGGGISDARHNREYTPREIEMLLADSGFDLERIETGEFHDLPHPELGWVAHLLNRYRLNTEMRGDGIYALARKSGPVRNRYPDWLYT